MGEQRERELISRREFARRQGWAPSYVVKLCQQGQITTWVECPGCHATVPARAASCDCGHAIAGAIDERKARIDPERALAELAAARDPARDSTRERWAQRRGDGTTHTEQPMTAAPAGTGISYAEAKARREAAEAALKHLELGRRRGELVERAAVRREAFRQARRMRDALLTLPDRLAQVLAVETDANRVHAALDRELRQVLESLSTDDDAAGCSTG